MRLRLRQERLRLRQERPRTLQKALELALELESFHLANRQQRMRVSRETKVQSEFTTRSTTTTTSTLDVAKRMEAASNKIAQSMIKLEALMRYRRNVSQKIPRNKDPRDLKCWKCGKGHFRHECPKRSPERDIKNTNDESARDGVPAFACKETRTGEASKGNLRNAV